MRRSLFNWLWSWSKSKGRVCAKQEHHAFNARIASMMEQNKTKRKEWLQRIDQARHLLTGKDWRDPSGKTEFVNEVYKGEIPKYLWYAIGNKEIGDLKGINDFFWGECGPDVGDLELHCSQFSEVGVGLRIRNPKKFFSEITLNGCLCPLYQTGHCDPWGGAGGQPTVLFLSMYKAYV
jgi:hypothetical protein